VAPGAASQLSHVITRATPVSAHRVTILAAGGGSAARSQKHCAVKAWGLRLAAKRGHKRALVAVARKLAVTMHRMRLDGSEFRFAASVEPERKRRAPRGEGVALGCGRDGTPVDTSSAGWRRVACGSKRTRRARYLAGDDACTQAESAPDWMCGPAISTQTCAPARQAGSSTNDCMDHQVQRASCNGEIVSNFGV